MTTHEIIFTEAIYNMLGITNNPKFCTLVVIMNVYYAQIIRSIYKNTYLLYNIQYNVKTSQSKCL